MNDFRRMAVALVDARAVVLSLLRQLSLDGQVNKEHLKTIVRQCALDMVERKLRPIGRKPRRRHGVKRVVSSRASTQGTRRVVR